MKALPKLLRDETGSTAVEYSLVISLIAVVIVTAVTTIGGALKNIFNSVANAL